MIAKQYTIKLPADYEMEIVRRRVRDRGAAFDDFPGLGLKAFLITERAAGATANRYAPFYLWHDVAGTNAFLYGDGFAGLTGSFGRPLVEHWIGMDARLGQTGEPPRSATREDRLVGEADLARVRDHERRWLRERADDDRGLYAAAVALDPYRWQLVRFALWSTPATQSTGADMTTYEVLHLSRPALDSLRQ